MLTRVPHSAPAPHSVSQRSEESQPLVPSGRYRVKRYGVIAVMPGTALSVRASRAIHFASARRACTAVDHVELPSTDLVVPDECENGNKRHCLIGFAKRS